MRTSDAGTRFIASFEGYVGHPYRDAVGVWTIGYGHTGADVFHIGHLTEPQARALLQKDLTRHYEPSVNALRLPLGQGQYDALVSFVYNLGPGYLLPGHTMGDALRRRNWRAAADAFMLYDRAGGNVLQGLYRRRAAERALFLSHPANPVAHKLAVWRAELTKRRAQLRSAGNGGTRHFLRRRIGALVDAIRKYR